jgi:hypothetical protein
VTHGDAPVNQFVTMPVQVDPAVVKVMPGLFPISRAGFAIHQAAVNLYEAILASNLDISPDALAHWTDQEVAHAVQVLLDACHDLVERRQAG